MILHPFLRDIQGLADFLVLLALKQQGEYPSLAGGKSGQQVGVNPGQALTDQLADGLSRLNEVNGLLAFEPQGDGDIFVDYKCSPGVLVDRWNVLISLRETKNAGDVTNFYIERTVKR